MLAEDMLPNRLERANQEMIDLINARARAYHLEDRDCPLGYEPSGQDFLSPVLAEVGGKAITRGMPAG